jgi:hypothetical protein
LYYAQEVPVVNPNSNPGLVGKTVFVTLFNGPRAEGRVTAMLNTVAGVKYRVVSGDLLFQVSREQICEGRRMPHAS